MTLLGKQKENLQYLEEAVTGLVNEMDQRALNTNLGNGEFFSDEDLEKLLKQHPSEDS
jgi:hypothetical protein